MAERFVLALDQGTTSSRAILYDIKGREQKSASRPLNVTFPQEAWVEQDPEEIWRTQFEAMKEAAAGREAAIAAIGITNQRETTIAWDKSSGAPLGPAIVWQCRRSADICAELRAKGLAEKLREKTGLVVDSYFSGTKIAWLMRNVPGLKAKVKKGEAVFGTVDSWLLYRLTGGKTLATDYSNASRTLLLALGGETWDPELLALFELTPANLCEVRASNAEFGTTALLGGSIPIRAVLGDQQASLFGHGCFLPASAKCTFGTGAFFLVNTGEEIRRSSSGLLTTIAWQLAGKKRVYALEGALFVAGSVVQWLRDHIKLFPDAAGSEALAGSVDSSGGVILIPAFVGLGAPHWSENVRGAIFGLTRDSSAAQIARAGLEGVAHQVADLFELPELSAVGAIKVDGGMVRNNLFCHILADFSGRKIERASSPELTAKGAAALAALPEYGGDLAALEKSFSSAAQGEVFEPSAPRPAVEKDRTRWKTAVSALLQTAGSV